MTNSLNRKRVLLRAPLLTQSGYGVHARQITKWLLSKDVQLDCQVLPWGDTPWIIDRNACDGLIGKIMERTKEIKSKYDVTFQLQLPNEWDPRLGDFNYGVTAAVETNTCSVDWIDSCEKMSHVIVPSSFVKKTFVSTCKLYNKKSLNDKISVVPESYPSVFDDASHSETIQFGSDDDFNFITIGQITSQNALTDRKNVLGTIKAFCEEFASDVDPKVGLVVKTNSTRNNSIDRAVTERIVREAVNDARKGKAFPRVHLVHGDMSDAQMKSLYAAKNVKAFITLTRGEGYGLPLLEASAMGIRVVAPEGSGYEEFLKHYTKIDSRFVQIPKEKADGKIFFSGTKWLNPSVDDFKQKIRSIANGWIDPNTGTQKKHVNENFCESAVQKRYDECVENTFRKLTTSR